MGFVMPPTCPGSTMIWVLLLGFWKTVSPQAFYGSLHSMGGCGISNTYQAKLQGMHAILLAVCSICQAFSLPYGTVTLVCNNLGVLSQLQYTKETISYSCKHADLLWACQAILCNIAIQVNFVHVLGHQDSQLLFKALDHLAQLNSMAYITRQYLLLAISMNIPSLPVGSLARESWSCCLWDGSKLTSDPHGPILFSLSFPLIQEYLSHCCHFLLATSFPLVSWPAIGYAYSFPPPLYHLWISMFVGMDGAHDVETWQMGQWSLSLL